MEEWLGIPCSGIIINRNNSRCFGKYIPENTLSPIAVGSKTIHYYSPRISVKKPSAQAVDTAQW